MKHAWAYMLHSDSDTWLYYGNLKSNSVWSDLEEKNRIRFLAIPADMLHGHKKIKYE